MARVNITEDGALVGWFDLDAATRWDEATRWDGQNRVSVNPIGQYAHQVLYRTASGRWVLHTWSQWQGSQPWYEFVDDAVAREWLLLNDEDDAAAAHFGPVEPERGPGRPEVGGAVHVRLGDLVARVDEWAAVHGHSRAAAVRELIAAGLRSEEELAEIRADLAGRDVYAGTVIEGAPAGRGD